LGNKWIHFFAKYLSRIQNKSISGRDFFIFRFSRIYPLHLATLCLIAILQIFYYSNRQTYFVYQNNHRFDFLLNLFMANSWGTKVRLSFNVPIWSVSAEVLVYLLFFLHIKFAKNIKFLTLVFIFSSICIMLLPGESWPSLNCLLYFYLGAGVYYMKVFFKKRNLLVFSRNLALISLIALPIIAWKFNLLGNQHFWKVFLVLWTPICVYLACYFETFRRFSNVYSVLGNLTYSAYLIHFPIQIVFTVLANRLFGYIPLHNLIFMLAWIFVTFVCSYFIFRKFEVPCQIRLRKIFT